MAAGEKKSGEDAKRSDSRVWWPGIVALGLAVVVVILILILGGGNEEPNIPSGAIAVIEHAPEGMGEITKAQFDHELAVNSALRGLRKAPKPGESTYDELGREAVETLIKRVWIASQAEELGLTVSPKELAAEVKKAKDKQYESEAEFKEYLGFYHQTAADFEEATRKEAFNAKIEDWLKKHAPKNPSQEEIQERFDQIASEYKAEPEERTFSFIVNKDRSKAERALKLVSIQHGTYHPHWAKGARLYSEDPKTKDHGGEETATEAELDEPLQGIVFGADLESQGQPPTKVLKTSQGYVVFQLGSVREASEKPDLEKREGELKQELRPQARSNFIAKFGAEFYERWGSRTFCSPSYGVELCANYKIPIEVGMCLSESEEGKSSVVPCSPGALKVTGTAGSSDECDGKSAQIHTATTTKVFCVEPYKAPGKNQK